MLALAASLVSAVATVTDLRARRIPNWLTYSTFSLALVWHSAHAQLPHAIASIIVPLILFGPVFWLGGVGGGDFKLALAIGCIYADFEVTLHVMLYTTLAGAALALVDAARKGQLGHVWRRLTSKQQRRSSPPLTIAYAPAFLFGTVIHIVRQLL